MFGKRRRIMVIGSGGAGKSTFARELATRTGLRLIHLDRCYWRADSRIHNSSSHTQHRRLREDHFKPGLALAAIALVASLLSSESGAARLAVGRIAREPAGTRGSTGFGQGPAAAPLGSRGGSG